MPHTRCNLCSVAGGRVLYYSGDVLLKESAALLAEPLGGEEEGLGQTVLGQTVEELADVRLASSARFADDNRLKVTRRVQWRTTWDVLSP